MATADLSVIGNAQTDLPRRIAASATRIEPGEPLHSTATSSSGAASANVYTLAAADTPVIGTHRFGGVAQKQSEPFKTGTLTAQTMMAACPFPSLGRIRGKGETAANVDTDAEILLLIGDYVLIDYDATGGADGGELYTIQDTASADTSGCEIVAGDAAKSTLDVTLAATAYRHDVS